MSNEDMIQKVIEVSSIGNTPGDGFLSIEQADAFIDHVFDATVLWKEAEKRKMNASYAEWPTARVGARIVKKATEATDDAINAGASFTKVSISTTKLRLDWELSTESLEDNIEGENLDEHLVRLFSAQLANDLEDISINGDTTLTSIPGLSAFDGWHKQALADGHVRTAATGTGNAQLSRAHFNQAIKALPRKYQMRKADLRFYASTGLIQDYLYSQSEMGIVPNEVIAGENHLRNYPVPSGAAGYTTSLPFGVQLREVPHFDTGFNEANAGTGTGDLDETSYLELTFAKNRVVGVQRDIKVLRQYVQRKDTIEYTVYVRFGVAWQDLDAVVTVTNIPVV